MSVSPDVADDPAGPEPARTDTSVPAEERNRPGTTADPTDRRGAFRADIEGIRGVAVLLVMLFHVGVPFLPGGYVGVDVFFVISGFLITSQLLAERARTGTVSLAAFYGRRAKRLLPATGLVLGVTALLAYLVVPGQRRAQLGGDIVASALYLVNWRFADRFADPDPTAPPSAVQHFWSLAVEEQYYLVWPVLIVVAVALAALLKTRTTILLGTVLGLLAGLSLLWSVSTTVGAQSPAFFQTTSRVWELAVGAGVALSAGAWARLPRVAAMLLGWAGLAAIVAAGHFYTPMMDFPGYTALLPVVGAAAVIAAGCAQVRGGAGSLLGIAPLRWAGGLSYSLYLWHWPLLSIVATHQGGLSVSTGLLVLACSVVPAWLTFHFVENPIRYSAALSGSPRRALAVGAACSLLGAGAGLALMAV